MRHDVKNDCSTYIDMDLSACDVDGNFQNHLHHDPPQVESENFISTRCYFLTNKKLC